MVLDNIEGTNVKIINGVYAERITEYLEEDLLLLGSLKTNAYADVFIKDIEVWDRELNQVADIMDLLMDVQRKFIYFNNIFQNLSDEIGQLIGDKNTFNNVKIQLIGYLNRFELEKNTKTNLLSKNFKETLKDLLE